jgi:NTP pyrophosphatase (non-canonical NTP hydrolase)
MKKSKLKKQIKEMNSKVTEWISQMRDTYEIEIRVNELNDNYKLDYRNLFDTISELKRNNSETKTIAKHLQNAESEIELLKAQSCNCHTNTQKENKNATETAESAKSGHSEVIISNEMFEEEVEKIVSKLNSKSITQILLRYTSSDNRFDYIEALIRSLKVKNSVTYIDIFSLIKSKLKSKGEHYNKISDRYANFKDALARNKAEQPELYANWTVVDKINSYKDKHIQWLIDTDGTKQTKEDIEEAYIDVICYCIMANIYLKFNGEVK